jgi:hypothetical protein
MDHTSLLSDFFAASQNDGRIGIGHIGLFAVLLELWYDGGCRNPVMAYSHEVQCRARIASRATYHTYIRDLHDFGYIHYKPSFKRNKRSEIFLLTEKKM